MITARQQDSLTELVNIAYGRAAAALSEMTAERVLLQVPALHVIGPDEIETVIGQHFRTHVTCVNQSFSGPISGNAALLLDERAGRILTGLISTSSRAPTADEVRATTTEVGNILINACLGVFGNLLRVQVAFTVPNVEVTSASGIIRSLKVNSETLDRILFVHTSFQLRDSGVIGYLAMMFGVASFERLIAEFENWDIP